MRSFKLLKLLLSMTIITLFTGCGGSLFNLDPTADAGRDRSMTIGESITINGSGEAKSDKYIVSYRWEEEGQILAYSSSFTYRPTSVGVHTLKLIVTDDEGDTDSDTMKVTVNPIGGQVTPTPTPTSTPQTNGTSSITGKVQDAISSSAISSASIKLYQNGTYIQEVQTNALGIYLFSNLSTASGYSLEISKSNYLTVNYSGITLEENTVKHLETVMHINESYEGVGTISGTIVGSIDGIGKSGLLINFREGMNNRTGTIVQTTTTGSNGTYSVSGLNAGIYTGELSADGYQTSYMTVIVLGDRTNANQNGTINPFLATGEIRIVLTWGATPSDLDSHLTGPISGSDDRFHVYWMDQGSINNSPYTNLDIDDVSSYGPETVTIRTQASGTYRYSIHDYSNGDSSSSNAMANSGAKIKVYKGSGLVREYFVPNEAGTLWTVFEINGNNINTINTMSYTSDYQNIP
jgi:hypothetical protein